MSFSWAYVCKTNSAVLPPKRQGTQSKRKVYFFVTLDHGSRGRNTPLPIHTPTQLLQKIAANDSIEDAFSFCWEQKHDYIIRLQTSIIGFSRRHSRDVQTSKYSFSFFSTSVHLCFSTVLTKTQNIFFFWIACPTSLCEACSHDGSKQWEKRSQNRKKKIWYLTSMRPSLKRFPLMLVVSVLGGRGLIRREPEICFARGTSNYPVKLRFEFTHTQVNSNCIGRQEPFFVILASAGKPTSSKLFMFCLPITRTTGNNDFPVCRAFAETKHKLVFSHTSSNAFACADSNFKIQVGSLEHYKGDNSHHVLDCTDNNTCSWGWNPRFQIDPYFCQSPEIRILPPSFCSPTKPNTLSFISLHFMFMHWSILKEC